ncbi:MAG: DUF3667 domain-containing protein [Sphingomonadaceae bacterium]
MEGTAEAAGQFATAAGVAAVVDPPAAPKVGSAATCLNCGAPVTSAYCGACGQKTHLHRTIGDAVHELVHNVLHFDGKVWKTLPLLAWKPGVLTREYIHGRRVRYVSPFALFLLTVFLTYLVFSFGGPRLANDSVQFGGRDGGASVSGAVSAEEGLAAARADLQAELEAARADPARAGDVARIERMLAGLDTVVKAAVRPDGSVGVGPDNLAEVIREAHASGAARVDFFGIESIEKKANAALANPELAFYKMKQKGYKLSFLLVPLSLPWLWLMFFWRRDYHGYDHVVFLLYSISFMSLLVIAAVLLSWAGVTSGWVYGVLLLGYPLFHLYRQLKDAYQLSRSGALVRTAFLSVAAVTTLSIYAFLVLLLGLID